MYLNVGEDISDMMLVGGVHTPINKDESTFLGTNPLIYGEFTAITVLYHHDILICKETLCNHFM